MGKYTIKILLYKNISLWSDCPIYLSLSTMPWPKDNIGRESRTLESNNQQIPKNVLLPNATHYVQKKVGYTQKSAETSLIIHYRSLPQLVEAKE